MPFMVGYSQQGCKESDKTQWPTTHNVLKTWVHSGYITTVSRVSKIPYPFQFKLKRTSTLTLSDSSLLIQCICNCIFCFFQVICFKGRIFFFGCCFWKFIGTWDIAHGIPNTRRMNEWNQSQVSGWHCSVLVHGYYRWWLSLWISLIREREGWSRPDCL